MLLWGPCEITSPCWLPTLLALGGGGCPVPVSLAPAHHGRAMPSTEPCSGQVCREPIWQLGTRPPASFTCTITAVWCKAYVSLLANCLL